MRAADSTQISMIVLYGLLRDKPSDCKFLSKDSIRLAMKNAAMRLMRVETIEMKFKKSMSLDKHLII